MGLIARGWMNAARLRRKRERYDNAQANRRREDLVREYAPGRSFVDVGCMWGADARFSFLAEEVGATKITGLDGMAPTDGYSSSTPGGAPRSGSCRATCTTR